MYSRDTGRGNGGEGGGGKLCALAAQRVRYGRCGQSDRLTALRDTAGFMYAESMINAAIDNLTGGGIVGDMQKGFADKENHAASASLTRQFVTASQTGMLEVESEYDMDFVAADDSDSDEDSDD